VKHSTRKVQNFKTDYFLSLKDLIYVQLNLKLHNQFYFSNLKQETSVGVEAAFCVQAISYHIVTWEYVSCCMFSFREFPGVRRRGITQKKAYDIQNMAKI